ncbi:hypothetical protein AYW79_02620 [Ferroacidibacillus organovorans]|uniref:histidine kinase n=2 Tax=Ferroacidibacillus organovorans TaxID=1765683 RepID=A0A853KCZ8_9BACL|nr:hypothetical protein AYJ22_05265 [Ferroacidibacillus organovorans]OAG94906.1 hypothetical protein AYW79_02620 [Ferroacidibacillus organovorans]
MMRRRLVMQNETAKPAVRRFPFFSSVRWKLLVVYLLLILFAMQLIGAYFVQSLHHYFVDAFERSISQEATFLSSTLQPTLGANRPLGFYSRDLVHAIAHISNATIYVLDKDGNVLATSGNPYLVGLKRVDPEVTSALLGLQDTQIALDPSTSQRQLYFSQPLHFHGQIVGAVEFVAPMQSVDHSISIITLLFATGTLLALALTAFLAVIIAQTITGPISAITQRTRELAAGNFDSTVQVRSNDEIGELASTFNMLTRRLQQSIANTEQEKGRLQAVMSNMSEGVIAVDRKFRVLLLNPAAGRLLGRAPEQLVGEFITSHLDVDGDRTEPMIIDLLGRFVEVSLTALQRRSSRTESVEMREDFGGYLIVLRDVTAETRLEESRKRFVADVSHELRTPITSLKSYLEALLEGAREDPVTEDKFLRVMERETDRMARLIRDLLQLSRFDSGYEALHCEPVPVEVLLHRVTERFSLLAFQSNIQFITKLSDTGVWIQIDRDRIEQAIDNIISNALKYTPSGGKITVDARMDESKEWVMLTISDTGSGIDPRELPHIFERFYRVDLSRARQLGGSGLGLSIAKEIIEAHGGTIRATSARNEGTAFVIGLPVCEGEIEDEHA